MASEFLQAVEALDLRFVRVVWCDNANVLRGKAIHRTVLAGPPRGFPARRTSVGPPASEQGIPHVAGSCPIVKSSRMK